MLTTKIVQMFITLISFFVQLRYRVSIVYSKRLLHHGLDLNESSDYIVIRGFRK